MHPRRPLHVSHQLELEPQQNPLHLSELLVSGVFLQVTSSHAQSMFHVIIMVGEGSVNQSV